jgi:hypothetical protein
MNLRAPTAKPTFTSGATVNGDRLSVSTSAVPQTRVSPGTNGAESSLAFYRNANQSGTSAGDVWTLGHGAHGLGAGNFAIGASTIGSCLSISSSGTVNINYSLTIAGQPAATRPWVAGHFDGTTTPSVTALSDFGQRAIGVSRTSVGIYVVSWTGAHPRGAGYAVFANMNVTAGFLGWDRTSTSLTLRAFTNTGIPQDPAEIDFMVPS